MGDTSKLSKLLRTSRDPKEAQDWIFSLTPLGVAFVFFFVFLLPMDLPNKDMIMVMGLAAGFTGLESYWIFRGWRKNHGSTVVMGILGIAITVAAVWGYVTLAAA